MGSVALCPLAGADRVDSCGGESEAWLAQRTLTHPAAQGMCLNAGHSCSIHLSTRLGENPPVTLSLSTYFIN